MQGSGSGGVIRELSSENNWRQWAERCVPQCRQFADGLRWVVTHIHTRLYPDGCGFPHGVFWGPLVGIIFFCLSIISYLGDDKFYFFCLQGHVMTKATVICDHSWLLYNYNNSLDKSRIETPIACIGCKISENIPSSEMLVCAGHLSCD